MSRSPQHPLFEGDGGQESTTVDATETDGADGPTLTLHFSDGSTFEADSDTLVLVVLTLQTLLLVYLAVLARRNNA